MEIRKLSDGDLRAKLKSLGQNVGPLTGTTRRLFEKRLARLLCPVKESDEDVTTFKQDKPDSEGDQAKKNISSTNEGASSVCSSASDPSLKGDGKEKEGVSQTSEATVFYAVCLPPGTSPPQPGTNKKSLIFIFTYSCIWCFNPKVVICAYCHAGFSVNVNVTRALIGPCDLKLMPDERPLACPALHYSA